MIETEGSCEHTKKKQDTRGIFHGLPIETIAELAFFVFFTCVQCVSIHFSANGCVWFIPLVCNAVMQSIVIVSCNSSTYPIYIPPPSLIFVRSPTTFTYMRLIHHPTIRTQSTLMHLSFKYPVP